MDVGQRFEELIRADGDDVLIVAGHPLSSPGQARQWADQLRSELTRRFVERRPHATEHTWYQFLALLDAEVRGMRAPTEDAVEELRMLVDGL